MTDERSERNALLRAARERLPSRRVPGEPLSRAELAELVNTWLWQHTRTRYALDDHAIARWERGRVRWPVAPYRAALRAVLEAGTDHELGFSRPPRGHSPAPAEMWSSALAAATAQKAVDDELVGWRGEGGVTVASGAALLTPLGGWLETAHSAGLGCRRGAFSVDEVIALEAVAAAFRKWRAPGSGLGRLAVVGQLSEVGARLDGAPDDALTNRVFLVGAELAKIAGSMAFDEGRAAVAQRHYITAVRMAKAGHHTSFGAVALAALARQSFDLGNVADGLELVALAQRGSTQAPTPALLATLATREAWGYALSGSIYSFQRAVDAAEAAFSTVDMSVEPEWLHGLDRAEFAGVIGARYRDLARHDRGQARHAVTYIRRALDWRGAEKPRNRALDLVSLARVHLLTGEHEESAATVRRALPLLNPCRPGRLVRKLADWHHESDPFASVPAVTSARLDIADLIAV